MDWFTIIVEKYPGWTLVSIVIVLLAFAEAIGNWFHGSKK